MALSKKPVNGMKDILPEEMQIRDYVQQVIKETYRSFGFTPIETPCMENIANLSNKQGGENEKLIFKVMKRGEKLKIAEAKEEADLVDFGMRYDLTVPLVRFYANNANDLPSPFKALQMGSVWRADRPQRGRYRQFMQCDIDIIGEPSNLAEIELILATTTTIGRLGFKNFEIRINERRILKAMAAYSGVPEEEPYSSFWTRWIRSVLTAWQKNSQRKAMRRSRLTSIWHCLRAYQRRRTVSNIWRTPYRAFWSRRWSRISRRLSIVWRRRRQPTLRWYLIRRLCAE